MVLRETFINKIRELGYKYKDTQKRTYLYRKAGSTHYISVPMKDKLDDVYVQSTLAMAGLSAEEIRSFMASAKS
jgi:hypothetical protein